MTIEVPPRLEAPTARIENRQPEAPPASPVPEEAPPAAPRAVGVTFRVVVLSLVLAAFFGYVIPIVDFKLSNTPLGSMHLPVGAIGVLLALLLIVNPLLGFLGKAAKFSRNETLTVYITCLFSCLVPGHGSETFALFNVITPFYQANSNNGWLKWLQPHLPWWMTPALTPDGAYNRGVVDGWFVGTGAQPIPWGAWLAPLFFWAALVLASYFMFACLSVMLRAQWGEKEALAFPLLRLPLTMTEGMDGGSTLPPFFRNNTMWLGFGLVVVIRFMNGLNFYFPDVPPIPLGIPAAKYLTEAPWNQIGFIKFSLIPIVVGISFLLTTEMSFSLWFFMWFIKFEFIFAYIAGFAPAGLPDAPGILESKYFTSYQTIGCNLAYVGLMVWLARAHLRHIADRAFRRARPLPAEANEVLSYPVAFWGFWGSLAFMTAATCATGVRIDVALALWISYLILSIGLARVAVEGGLLFLMYLTSPLGAIARLFSSGAGPWLTLDSGVVPASIIQNSMSFHMRGFLLPSFVQSFKLAYDRDISGRRLGWLIFAVILVTLGVAWPSVLRLGYGQGGLQLSSNALTQGMAGNSMVFTKAMLSEGNAPPPIQNAFWMGIGIALTVAMGWARARYLWFPFHPLGYLVSLTYPVQALWLSFFVAWLAKVLINRFSGSDGVRKATPFFLGLALGEVAMFLFWLLIDGWQGRIAHNLMTT